MRQWRRYIHQNPELGFQEKKTSGLAAKVLRQAGWQVFTGIARTGVVGVLRGSRPGPTFAIRADMDALPIMEKNRCVYASQVPQVMHACGHDGNTAMALGAAVLLARYRTEWRGNVKIIFQPCEEVPPGGAQAMIRAGVLKSPEVAAIIAAHVDTSLPVGSIGIKSGLIMAAADAFTLIIRGKGGHGAMPHKSVDAISIAGQVITNVQHVIARELDPLEPAVISFGTIAGGAAYNVIADQVKLQGTIRTLSDQQRKKIPRQIERLAHGIAYAHRAKAAFTLELGHPALSNDEQITDQVRHAGNQVLGKTRVKILARPVMSGEDFTYFARAVPACFFRVGVGTKDPRYSYPWHHPRFDFAEQGLVSGAAVLVQTAREYLRA
ncbi:amidohydrolase [bacterium]|nr:amidohydrolase [bacterium]